MNASVVDQVILWMIFGCATALATILLAMGKWIVGRIDRVQNQVVSARELNTQEMAKLGEQMRKETAQLRQEFGRDMSTLRERMARVEGISAGKGGN